MDSPRDINLIHKIYHACPEAIGLRDKDGLNPIQYAKDKGFWNDDLLKKLFSSQEWRIMSRDHNNSWPVDSFQFFDEKGVELNDNDSPSEYFCTFIISLFM